MQGHLLLSVGLLLLCVIYSLDSLVRLRMILDRPAFPRNATSPHDARAPSEGGHAAGDMGGVFGGGGRGEGVGGPGVGGGPGVEGRGAVGGGMLERDGQLGIDFKVRLFFAKGL